MAAARESISPLLSNVRSRRLSLELCQKIGSHLLSPNRNSGNSGGSDSPLSPSPSTPKLLIGSPISRFQNSPSISPSQSRRGSSGCIATSPLVTATLNALATSHGSPGDGAPPHNRRRSSLTPIYSNSPTPSSLTTSFNDLASFAVPTINVDASEESEYESERTGPPLQLQCQWNRPRRKSLNNDESTAAGAATTKQWQLEPSSLLSIRRNEGEQFKLFHSSDAFCSVIAHETAPAAAASRNDGYGGWEGNCDLNNNYNRSCNYIYATATNNENIGPEHRQPSGSSFLYHERRKSFPTVSHTHNQSHKTNNKNQLDETLAAVVAQQCSGLMLNPHEIFGKGSFGTVIAAVYRGEPAAVKVIHTRTPGNVVSLKGERNALRLQPHPNIARIYEIFQLGPQNQALIVMEQLRSGSLLTALNDSNFYLNGHSCIQLSCEIASALFYCHLNGILHLDVKPSNILIDFQNHCKLSDFGNSKTIQDLMSSTNYAQLDGTVAYIAPECFRGVTPTDKCDVYSFGITMWQILSRETPYQGETEHSIIYKVVAQAMRPKLIPQFHLAKFHSQETFRKYLRAYEMCWQTCPEARPNMQTVNESLLSLQKC